jgi:hypothetical protein
VWWSDLYGDGQRCYQRHDGDVPGGKFGDVYADRSGGCDPAGNYHEWGRRDVSSRLIVYAGKYRIVALGEGRRVPETDATPIKRQLPVI